MIKYIKYTLLILIVGLSACGGSDDDDFKNIQYSIILTDVALTKKGDGQVLTVSGLPARGATLTQE